jgi:hypothetical protein
MRIRAALGSLRGHRYSKRTPQVLTRQERSFFLPCNGTSRGSVDIGFRLQEHPLDYISTLRVYDMNGGKASRVEWSGRFTPNGVSEQEATRIVQGIYDGGLKALANSFASETK